MRALDDGLASPHPLGKLLPAIYQEDGFAQRFTQGLDAVLASLLSTLDNLDGYFDPDLAPRDYVDWLAGWLAIDVDEAATVESRRELLRRMPDLYRRRGTGRGLLDHIELVFGVRPEIAESGGTWWRGSRSAPPSPSEPRLTIRVRVERPAEFDRDALDAFVEANKPAHVPHSIEVLPVGGSPAPPPSPDGPAGPRPDGRLPEVSRSVYRGYGPVRRGDQ